MEIVLNCKNQREDPNYWDNVIEAIRICNNSIGLKKVRFKETKISEIRVLFTLIKQNTDTGNISFDDEYEDLIYEKSENDLSFVVEDDNFISINQF